MEKNGHNQLDHELLQSIRKYKNFPKDHVDFIDIFPIFHSPTLVDHVIQKMTSIIRNKYPDVTAIVCLDSRGFLFGPMLSSELKCKMVPIRKKGKLPMECHSISYHYEYGSGDLEMPKNVLTNNEKVVVVDDVLATGGTLRAADELLKKANYSLLGNLVLFEINTLNGRKNLESDTISLFCL
ncbi:hypothetical protein SNEBB_003739 [Seison nebaliae]|nr:hypothetical protein SNEBB_003739 [Seison nebaliae]